MKPKILPIGRRIFIAFFVCLWGQLLWANKPEEISMSSIEALESIEDKEVLQSLEQRVLPESVMPWVGWKSESSVLNLPPLQFNNTVLAAKPNAIMPPPEGDDNVEFQLEDIQDIQLTILDSYGIPKDEKNV